MLQRVIITVLLLTAAQAQAAVPQSMSLQGYLTDRIGSPIEASQSVTFAIYTVPVGGVPVWQETQSVAFSNGLFSVTLGTVGAFPPDLFDVPLWLGTTIGTDNEMEPRRALTTAGFSFRAEDADALQGRSAGELDQSGHVDDLANPHEVSTGQIGAASSGELAAHAGNAANPHLVTAGQTGATGLAIFVSHTADQAGHHLRYADAEAVNAMGVQAASNPLNHDRYTNTESFSAILELDGEGSGLNSDLVDGLQATDIIDAAAGAMGRIEYEFAGFSTETVDGSVGFLGLYQACQSTFGPAARISTTQEVLDSSLVPGVSVAWVKFTQVQSLSGLLYDVPSLAPSSSFVNFHCDQWDSSGSSRFGLAVDASSYRFTIWPCNVARQVACSVPPNGP